MFRWSAAVALSACSFLCACDRGNGGDEPKGARTASVSARSAPDADVGFRRELARAEWEEETTESFANALLDLSGAIVAGDESAIAAHFSSRIVGTGFPVDPLPVTGGPQSFLSRTHGWKPQNADPAMARDAFMEKLDRFLDHFSTLEDVRIKVIDSALDAGREVVHGEVKLSLIGRDERGNREWIRGRASVTGRRRSDGWSIEAFRMKGMDSLVAAREIFTDVTDSSGLSVSAAGSGRALCSDVAGAAAGDLDGDGFLDIVTIDADAVSLYVNRGNGTFAHVSERLHGLGRGDPRVRFRDQSPLLLDFDNDGDQDLFVTGLVQLTTPNGLMLRSDTRLLENRRVPEGELAFRDVSERLGPRRTELTGRSASAVDLNRDGYLDIYVCQWRADDGVLAGRSNSPNSYGDATNGAPNHLYLSRGDGTYEEVGEARGVAGRDWSMAAQFADIDDDGDFDLYVTNDFGPNRMYVNEGERFVERASEMHLQRGGAGMGVSFGDYDNDGLLDLHSTNMSSIAGERVLRRLTSSPPHPSTGGRGSQRAAEVGAFIATDGRTLSQKDLFRIRSWAQGNRLYRREGAGVFRDVTLEAGPFLGGWAFGGGFLDIDNDGWLDLYTPNGRRSGKSMHDT